MEGHDITELSSSPNSNLKSEELDRKLKTFQADTETCLFSKNGHTIAKSLTYLFL